MKKDTLVFVVLCLFGLLLVFTVYGEVLLDGKSADLSKNAPPLSDLFEDRADGPHQQFTTVENCLKCHKDGVNIPGMGVAPKIKHEIRNDCISCHKLPTG